MPAQTQTSSVLPRDPAGWQAFFSGYRDIVLVANSGAVDVEALAHRFGEGALFVFFNKVYKVLDGPFARPALLVARSSAAGANIVYRREVQSLLAYFDADSFVGFLNIRAGHREVFSAPGDFGGRPAGILDLAGAFDGFYSADHLPSSGFALALWLVENTAGPRIHLAGFTGQRSRQWKIFRDHDWTFEQVVQRLLLRSGRLVEVDDGPADRDVVERIAARFPEFGRQDVLASFAQVLARRLDQGDGATDELITLTRPQRRLRSLLARLKPKTRKQRLTEKKAG